MRNLLICIVLALSFAVVLSSEVDHQSNAESENVLERRGGVSMHRVRRALVKQVKVAHVAVKKAALKVKKALNRVKRTKKAVSTAAVALKKANKAPSSGNVQQDIADIKFLKNQVSKAKASHKVAKKVHAVLKIRHTKRVAKAQKAQLKVKAHVRKHGKIAAAPRRPAAAVVAVSPNAGTEIHHPRVEDAVKAANLALEKSLKDDARSNKKKKAGKAKKGKKVTKKTKKVTKKAVQKAPRIRTRYVSHLTMHNVHEEKMRWHLLKASAMAAEKLAGKQEVLVLAQEAARLKAHRAKMAKRMTKKNAVKKRV